MFLLLLHAYFLKPFPFDYREYEFPFTAKTVITPFLNFHKFRSPKSSSFILPLKSMFYNSQNMLYCYCYDNSDIAVLDSIYYQSSHEKLFTDLQEFQTLFSFSWKYQSASELNGRSVWGRVTTYEGGGYTALLADNKKDTVQIIKKLKV